jgi:hypothetical protein
MALIPYAKRVAQSRAPRGLRDGDGRRGGGDDQVQEQQVDSQLEDGQVDDDAVGGDEGEES